MGGVIAGFLAGVLIAGFVGFCFGSYITSKAEIRKSLREAGLTKESAKLLGRAAKILRRLEGLTDLDGDLAADILTPASRKLVSEWVADYRKGLEP